MRQVGLVITHKCKCKCMRSIDKRTQNSPDISPKFQSLVIVEQSLFSQHTGSLVGHRSDIRCVLLLLPPPPSPHSLGPSGSGRGWKRACEGARASAAPPPPQPSVVVNHDERSRQLQLHRGSKRGQESQEEGREGGEEKRGGIIQAAASVQSELGLQ